LETVLALPPDNTYNFDIGESKEERLAGIRLLPNDVSKALHFAILCITEPLTRADGDAELPLIWWMATDDMDHDEPQAHSADWRARVWRWIGGAFYDINGWPGDNEYGIGLCVQDGHDGFQALFSNVDGGLTAEDHLPPAATKIVEAMETARLLLRNPDDSEDSNNIVIAPHTTSTIPASTFPDAMIPGAVMTPTIPGAVMTPTVPGTISTVIGTFQTATLPDAGTAPVVSIPAASIGEPMSTGDILCMRSGNRSIRASSD
jgi:hypothetical protein